MKSYRQESYSNEKARLEITPDLCKGCGICVEFCPTKALEMNRNRVVVRDMEACTACGLCEIRCPDFAIAATRVGRLAKEAPSPTLPKGEEWPIPQGEIEGPWGRRLFLQGNEACAEGAIYAGCRFFGGYPITPSTEIAEHLSARLPELGGTFIQMEDEIASLASSIGASLTGVKAMTATSGPGFSLMQENLGYASHCEIPIVIVNIMRGGPSTGLPTSPSQSDIQQARWGTHGDHPIIALTPGNVQEMFTETVRAFNLAERFRVPVLIMVDEIIGHMREAIKIPAIGEIKVGYRAKPTCPPEEYLPYRPPVEGEVVAPMANFGDGYRFHVTGLNFNQRGFPVPAGQVVHDDEVRKEDKLLNNLGEIESNEEYLLEDAEVVVFAYGTSALSARLAINTARSEGIRVGLFRPRTMWPFPYKRIRELSHKVKGFVVPELNLGQAILEVERAVAERCPIHGILYAGGQSIKPIKVLQAIQEVAK